MMLHFCDRWKLNGRSHCAGQLPVSRITGPMVAQSSTRPGYGVNQVSGTLHLVARKPEQLGFSILRGWLLRFLGLRHFRYYFARASFRPPNPQVSGSEVLVLSGFNIIKRDVDSSVLICHGA
jgi:hypothetical protein